MEDLLSEFSDDGLGDTSMRADVQISKKTDEKQKDFSATQITSILDCMEANPQLWDKRNDGYKDRTTNLATWHSLEKTLGFLVVDRDFVRRKSQTIDNSIEKLLNTLNKNDENEKKSQHKDIMDKVNHTLAALNPSDQFDCKVALAQVCDRFLRKGSAHFSQYDDSRIVQTPRTSMRSSSSMRIPSRSSNGNSSSSNRYVAEECSTSSITHREDLQLSIGDPSYTEQHYPNYHHSTDSYTPMQYTESELGEEFEVVSYEDETF
ncbi:hypothetical protein CAEBREN_16689 [Caenorhabditis brenneri]|uniref:MADF domain-containing protein n=1 Tax=Caenorhabditis brenneri TaxID=135651 RepID=G0MUP0_CAEBE|nr:hypothetical protein CAEBREN_16689 [Caenorhabditis brenneri]